MLIRLSNCVQPQWKSLGAFWTIALLASAVLISSTNVANATDEFQLASVRKIWGQAPHNAFTDIIRFKDSLWIVFREGATHASPAGKLRLLKSTDDGQSWLSAATITLPEWDLRDPHFSITPDNRLMLSGGARQGVEAKSERFRSIVSFSQDGTSWTPPQLLLEGGSVQENRWLWQTTWQDGTSYGIDYYCFVRPGNTVRLLASTDGINYTKRALLLDTDWPTEATIRFANDGTAYALQRRDRGTKTTMLGTSHAPYTEWSWVDLKIQLSGGPNLLQLPNGQWVAAGRIFETPGDRSTQRILLAALDIENGKLTTLHTLPPPGGANTDAAYPGLSSIANTLFMTYYATPPKDNTGIYLAKFTIIP